jgi:hypothetical protein
MRSFSPALQMSFWHFSDMRPCPTRVHYRHQSGRPPVQVHGFTPWLSLLAALPGPTVAMGRGSRMQNRRHHDVPRWPKSAPNGAGGPNTSDWTRCSRPLRFSRPTRRAMVTNKVGTIRSASTTTAIMPPITLLPSACWLWNDPWHHSQANMAA